MAGGEGELTGPDLRAGVPLASLEEGVPFAGHADGEAILLFRRGDAVSAVGATCTHYGGPLREGVVTGETIRCPWHHACFSLRTGEMLAAPALNDLPQWRTRVVAGVVHVAEQVERDALDPRGRSITGPSSVVIIGAGAAGSAAAETLRREGYAGPVMLVDPDRDAPYDRPNLSKDYLAGNAPEEWIPLRPRGFYEAHDISRVITAATAIDPVKRTVTLEDGPMLEFGALLLATGAAPVRPPIPGSTQPHVHVLRSLVDCRALIRGATAAGHVVIAGASFIGLEAAASLRTRGVAVSVVAPEAIPFERTLGADLGRMLAAEHERHGVEFRLGRTLKEIRQSDVVLDDDSVMPADLVLLGVGVRPLLELAQTAGLAEKNGVPVNRYLETRTAGIFAAGDIALHPDPRTDEQVRIEHWVVAQRQGQTVARNILGRQEPFDSVPFFWTNHYGLTVSYTGHAASWDDIRVTGDVAARDCTVRYSRNGALLAVATVNRDRANLEAELALEAAGRSSGPVPSATRDHGDDHASVG